MNKRDTAAGVMYGLAFADALGARTEFVPTAWAVADQALGSDPAGLLERLQQYARGQRGVYHAAWLGDHWQRPAVDSPEGFIGRGWDECLDALERITSGLRRFAHGMDPCELTGAGWTAEEALVTALLCFLFSPEDAVSVVRDAATTSGDSDSIACIAGALVGAHRGQGGWPMQWAARIEYRDRLERLVTFFGGNA